MIIPCFHVDAFADRLFEGNPAAVCVLQQGWLPDVILQRIAAEFKLSETAFLVPNGQLFWRIRWFTPCMEVKLCGHATLASAHVIFELISKGSDLAVFESASGRLSARRRSEGIIELDFPSAPPLPCEPPAMLSKALGAVPAETLCSGGILLSVFDSESDIRALSPDFKLLASIPEFKFFIASAPGLECDFVSRFFAPAVGIDEDPATGMAHTVLTPFWAERLETSHLNARQLSARGASLICEQRGFRVAIAGRCVRFSEGFIEI